MLHGNTTHSDLTDFTILAFNVRGSEQITSLFHCACVRLPIDFKRVLKYVLTCSMKHKETFSERT